MAKKDKDRSGDRNWAEALGVLEARLARLEAAFAATGGALPEDPEPGPEGRVRMSVRGAQGDWRHEVPIATLSAADWPALAPRLAALGHPVRLAILRAVADGASEAAVLQQAAGAATPGQFYHHLRELTATGWLVAERRGRYALPPGRAGMLWAAVALGLA
jgi:DNA-binding transcriptional ArsR family regulator